MSFGLLNLGNLPYLPVYVYTGNLPYLPVCVHTWESTFHLVSRRVSRWYLEEYRALTRKFQPLFSCVVAIIS
uniref:Uncharacterized protein n=1 Tax=Oryza brachyantha TaxID=4533 RepID=J3M4U7_ORYBR